MPSAEVIPMEEHRQQIEFDAAVKEGKEIVARREKDQWRLGEIAANLKPIYGEATLEKFAEEIGFDYNTIWTYRQTFLDWQGIQKPPRGGFYAIARELNKHPDRAKIVLPLELPQQMAFGSPMLPLVCHITLHYYTRT
jgi:hypothetical protein